MARKGKKCYGWFLRPNRYIARQRRKLVPEVIMPPTEEVIDLPTEEVIDLPTEEVIDLPTEELREEGPFCGPVLIPHQQFHNTLSHSVVELIIEGPSDDRPISIPGIILIAKNDLIGILFGGNLIIEGNDYRLRLPNMVKTKEVRFEDFMIKDLNNYGGARLALLAYRPEVALPCNQIELGMNCSRNELLFLYDFRPCENYSDDSDVYESALNDGHATISDHSTFALDSSPVSHSYQGGLVFDSVGKLIGIGYDTIGPILAFHVSLIQSALMEINPEAENIADVFLNLRRI